MAMRLGMVSRPTCRGWNKDSITRDMPGILCWRATARAFAHRLGKARAVRWVMGPEPDLPLFPPWGDGAAGLVIGRIRDRPYSRQAGLSGPRFVAQFYGNAAFSQ